MKISIISPSAGTMRYFPHRVQRGLRWMRENGWEPILGAHALESAGYVSAPAEARAADIHHFLASDVDVILAAIGGYNSNQLLPLLDYDAMQHSGKVFCGYSDVTALLLAAAVRGGCRCIYGPTFLPEICEFPEPYELTVRSLRDALSGGEVRYTHPEQTVSEYIDWAEQETGECRAKYMSANAPWAVLRQGTARGPIWGGNLQTLLWILGTEYFPCSKLDNAIFFFEDLEENPAVLDAMLQSLHLRGVFDRISGLITGRFVSPELTWQMDQLLLRLTERRPIPILRGVDIGHVDPMLSIPLGAETELRLEGEITWRTAGFSGRLSHA